MRNATELCGVQRTLLHRRIIAEGNTTKSNEVKPYSLLVTKVTWHQEFFRSHSPPRLLVNRTVFTRSWSWALLEKQPFVQLLKNFPAFYGTRKFITVFTRSLPWARSIQSIPSHPISLRSILILSTHLRLCLRSSLFPSGFATNILYAVLPHSCYMPCPFQPLWFDHSYYTWRRVQVMKFLIM
jgi:hypothetical protein